MKGTQNLYCGNYKTFLKEMEEDLSRWKGIPHSWIGRQHC